MKNIQHKIFVLTAILALLFVSSVAHATWVYVDVKATDNCGSGSSQYTYIVKLYMSGVYQCSTTLQHQPLWTSWHTVSWNCVDLPEDAEYPVYKFTVDVVREDTPPNCQGNARSDDSYWSQITTSGSVKVAVILSD